MLFLKGRLRQCRGRDALVTDAGDIAWVFTSVEEYCSRWADHAMENGVKGHGAGCGGRTHIQDTASVTLWHTFFFFFLYTWTQFHPPSDFPFSNINYGRFKLCTAWQTSETHCVSGPFLLWRLPDGLLWSEMETPHLVTSENSLGKLRQSKCRLKLRLKPTKHIHCVSVVESSTILSQKTPFDFKKLLISCFSHIPSTRQTVNLAACLSNIKSEWSIAKHCSMKSKPLLYPSFFFIF